jgi:hypothetical protein
MKKLLALLVLPLVAVSSFVGVTAGQFTNTNNLYTQPENDGNTDSLGLIGAGAGTTDSFVNVVKGGVNWVLGILALIALIILLWGGFQMVTASGDEEKYKKGFTILKQAAIGLILIGIAWFIISIIFWLVNITAQDATP